MEYKRQQRYHKNVPHFKDIHRWADITSRKECNLGEYVNFDFNEFIQQERQKDELDISDVDMDDDGSDGDKLQRVESLAMDSTNLIAYQEKLSKKLKVVEKLPASSSLFA